MRAEAMLALAALLAGCAHLPLRSRAVDPCPGALTSTRTIPGDFLLRQRVRVESGERAFSFELAVQKQADELLVVGIDPLGAKLFSVVQRGVETRVEALPAPVLEVPPLNVLRDLHRARFLRADAAPPHGVATAVRGSDRLLEIWQDGRLRASRIARDGVDGEVRIEFSQQAPGKDGGERVWIDNGWCDYRTEIVTLSEQALR